MTKRLIVIIFSIAFSCMALHHASEEAIASSLKKDCLSDVVFFGIPPVKEIAGRKAHQLASECLRKYLKAIPSGSWLWKAGIPKNPEKVLQYKRRNLEEQIVVLLGEATRTEARAFSRAVPLGLEWEGGSEGPLTEADFVDNWLSNRPGTPIAPFLYLFKAHRLRAAFEAAKFGNEKDLWPILAVRYKEALEKTLSFKNPLISCIAQDMEAKPYVYLEGHGRP